MRLGAVRDWGRLQVLRERSSVASWLLKGGVSGKGCSSGGSLEPVYRLCSCVVVGQSQAVSWCVAEWEK